MKLIEGRHMQPLNNLLVFCWVLQYVALWIFSSKIGPWIQATKVSKHGAGDFLDLPEWDSLKRMQNQISLALLQQDFKQFWYFFLNLDKCISLWKFDYFYKSCLKVEYLEFDLTKICCRRIKLPMKGRKMLRLPRRRLHSQPTLMGSQSTSAWRKNAWEWRIEAIRSQLNTRPTVPPSILSISGLEISCTKYFLRISRKLHEYMPKRPYRFDLGRHYLWLWPSALHA